MASLMVTLAYGLAAAACLCLAYAVLRRTPDYPLLVGRGDVSSVLWRTAGVVVVMVVLMAAYAVVALRSRRPATGYPARTAALLRYLAPTLGLLAALGLWLRWRDETAKLFARAERQQVALDGVRVVDIASVSWICACVAVAALAVAAATRSSSGGSGGRQVGRTLLAVVTLLAVTAVAVFLGHRPTIDSATAVPSETPQLVIVSDAVAYEVPVDEEIIPPRIQLVVAGEPGLLRVMQGKGAGGVEGISGSTGETVWSFSQRDLGVNAIGVGGTGPDSVVVVSVTYWGEQALIGLDADTGTPLWATPDSGHLVTERSNTPEVSSSVVLTTAVTLGEAIAAQDSVPWTAWSLRTGVKLWSTEIPYECSKQLYVTESYVLTPNCEGDAIVDVRDAQTGAVHTTLRAADIGVDLQPGDSAWATGIPATDLVLVSVQNYQTSTILGERILDASTGQVVHTVPPGLDASVLDSQTVILSDADTRQTVLDLESGVTIDTGLSTEGLRFINGFGQPWARIGNQWATLIPAPGETAKTLKVFQHDAPMVTHPSPCASDEVPRMASIPGALVINCGDRVMAIR
ncbi:hypothetical protein [Mycobacterium sp. C31M]